MKKKITLIRHTESVYNHYVDRGYDTTSTKLKDCGLTIRGRVKANKINNEYDLVILSPLRRCIDTYTYSKIVAQRMMVSLLFREYKTDICDFMNDEDINSIETEKEVLERVEKCKEFLRSLDYKRVAVITHGDLIWYLTSYTVELDRHKERFGKHLKNGESCEINV